MRFEEAYAGWQAGRLRQEERRDYSGCVNDPFGVTSIGMRKRACKV